MDFIKKYKDRPFYLKVPLWVFEDLKERFMGLIDVYKRQPNSSHFPAKLA